MRVKRVSRITPSAFNKSDDMSNPVQTTTTGADGKYEFVNMEPGTYVVGVKPNELGTDYYLLPIVGVTGDNKFTIDTSTWIIAYTMPIEIGADTVITGVTTLDLSGVTLAGMTSFPARQFSFNTARLAMALPAGLTSIELSAFSGCTSPSSIDLSGIPRMVHINGSGSYDTFEGTPDVMVTVPYTLFDDYEINFNWGYSVDKYNVLLLSSDVTSPTGEITIKNNKFTSFLNAITFGLFFKDKVNVTIEGYDAESGVASIEHQKVALEGDYDSNGIWGTYNNSFSVDANEKFIIYAKITDKADNITIISSDGVVVYTDSQGTVDGGSFSKASTDDLPVSVTMNGNTVKSITNGSVTLTEGSDYTVDYTTGGTITFKNAYLKSLADGTQNFAATWYPLGETTAPATGSDTPGTTTVTVRNAGTVTVTAVKAGDNNYNPATATLKITVSPRDISNITVAVTGSTVYTGGQLQPAFTASDGTLAIDTGDYTNNYGENITVAQGGTITSQRNYTGTKTISFNILAATPAAITFPATDAVTYDPGKTLADITLSGGAGDGTFAWQDDAIVSTANNSGYTVVFTPRDTDNYDYSGVTLTQTVALTVSKAEQNTAY